MSRNVFFVARWAMIVAMGSAVLLTAGLLMRAEETPQNPAGSYGSSVTRPTSYNSTPMVKVWVAKGRSAKGQFVAHGSIEAAQQLQLKPSIAGEVVFVAEGSSPTGELEIGQFVEAGTPLVKVDPTETQLQLALAEAQLARAIAEQTELQTGTRPEEIGWLTANVAEATAYYKQAIRDLARAEKQHPENAESVLESLQAARQVARAKLVAATQLLRSARAGTTKTELAVAAARVNEARATVAAAKHQVASCVMRAPFSGLVTAVHVTSGMRVDHSEELLELTNLNELVAVAKVDRELAGRVVADGTARIESESTDPITGRVAAISPTIDIDTQQFQVRVHLGQCDLLPGQFASIHIPVQSLADRLTIPEDAVAWDNGSAYVFELKEDKLHKRPITLGATIGGYVEVKSGLEVEATIVVDSDRKLFDGMSARVDSNWLEKGKLEPLGRGSSTAFTHR